MLPGVISNPSQIGCSVLPGYASNRHVGDPGPPRSGMETAKAASGRLFPSAQNAALFLKMFDTDSHLAGPVPGGGDQFGKLHQPRSGRIHHSDMADAHEMPVAPARVPNNAPKIFDALVLFVEVDQHVNVANVGETNVLLEELETG